MADFKAALRSVWPTADDIMLQRNGGMDCNCGRIFLTVRYHTKTPMELVQTEVFFSFYSNENLC